MNVCALFGVTHDSKNISRALMTPLYNQAAGFDPSQKETTMIASINLNNSAAETPVSSIVLDALPKSAQNTTDCVDRMKHAHRIAAFAVAARSLMWPLLRLSSDLESLSDMIGDENPPYVLLTANIAADMAINHNLSYSELESGHLDETSCMLDGDWDHLVAEMIPCPGELFDCDHVAFHQIKEAYIHAVGCLMAENTLVLHSLTSSLLSGVSLDGEEASIMIDDMMDAARVSIRSMF